MKTLLFCVFFLTLYHLNCQTMPTEEIMVRAIEQDDRAAIAQALEEGVGLETPLDTFGNTALHLAVKLHRPAAFEFLMEQNPDLEKGNTYEVTPLGVAANYCNINAAKKLIGKGANLEAASTDGATPLGIACQSGCLPLARLLAERGADIHYASPVNGLQPIHRAAFANAAEIIEFLLARGARADAPSLPGYTPLHALVFGFDQKGYDIYQKGISQNQKHILLDSLKYQFDKSLRQLITAGARLYLPDSEGKTVVDYAIESNSEAFATYIEKTASTLQTDDSDSLKLIIPVRHNAGINSVRFSPSGHVLASAANDGAIKIWNTFSGREARTLRRLDDDSGVSSIQFSPDGRFLLAAYNAIGHNLVLWDWQSGQEIRRFIGHGSPVAQAIFNHDGSRIFSASWDATVKVWDAETATLLNTLEGHTAEVASLALSPDGSRLASGGYDKAIILWDLKTGKPEQRLEGHGDMVMALAFGPSPGQLTSGAFDKAIKVWDMGAGSVLREARLMSQINALQYQQDGKTLLVGAVDKIYLYDMDRAELLQSISRHQLSVNTVNYSPDFRYFASGSNDKSTLLWAADNPDTPLRDFSNAAALSRLAASGSKAYQIVTTYSQAPIVNTWSLETGRLTESIGPQRSSAEAFWLDPATGRMAIATGETLYDSETASIQSFSQLEAYGPDFELLTRIRAGGTPVFALSLSPDGKFLAASFSSIPYRYQESGEPPELMEEMNNTFRNSALNIWRLEDKKIVGHMEFPGRHINSLSFDPSGKYLLVGANQGFLAVYSLENDSIREQQQLLGHGPARFLARQTILNSTPERQLVAQNWQQGTQRPFEGTHDRIITALSLSLDGRLAATGGADDQIKIWEVSTGRLLHTLRGHTEDILSVSFAGNDSRLISSALDHTSKIWDTHSGKLLLTLISLSNGEWMAITPDGYYTASKGAAAMVSFSRGNRTFEFEQFDLQYNRPDIVMERLGKQASPLYQALVLAHEKRQERLGFGISGAGEPFSSPIVQPEYEGLPLSTPEREISLIVVARDSVYPLRRLMADINGVPAFGREGIAVEGGVQESIRKEIQIKLSHGQNKIQVWAVNEPGIESEKETFYIRCETEAAKPRLYLLGFGLSRFEDSSLNLQYADKDVEDVARLFRSQAEAFGKVETRILANKEATPANFLKARDWLANATVDDAVIIYIATHGFFDKDGNYFLAAYGTTSDKPFRESIPYQELEQLLDGVAARQRLIVIDACHAGEVDMESLANLKSRNTEEGKIKFRGFNLEKAFRPLGESNALELMKELFADLRRGTGATVIAGASGTDAAIEGPDWQNGAFTYCLLKGLREGQADLDGDGQVSVSELQQYLAAEVPRLTEGQQQPTFRVENISNDWRVW